MSPLSEDKLLSFLAEIQSDILQIKSDLQALLTLLKQQQKATPTSFADGDHMAEPARLTLNVLLSFAQFEREVIGERVRDKIAASKKKGMWMGGMPPLGYDVKDRQLIINGAEAHTVIDIYRRYLALKSVRALADELVAAGIRSKRRIRLDGTEYGRQKLSRGALYLMLQNRIYRGEITHKGHSYSGNHPAIIEQPLWDQVQAVLATNRTERATGTRTKHPSLLTGLLFDDKGGRLTPTYATKKGRRYRYYVYTGSTRQLWRRFTSIALTPRPLA
jgi:site-specific DNA recombinase